MTVHVYTAPNKRMRRRCPYCEKMEYGNRQDFYDGSYFFFDCGTSMVPGDDCMLWSPPPKKKCHLCRKSFSPIEMIQHLAEHHRITGEWPRRLVLERL